MTPILVKAALALSTSPGLSIVVKVTIMLLLGLAAARLATRAQASVRHLILVASFATLIVLPLLAAALPRTVIELPGQWNDVALSTRMALPATAATPATTAADPATAATTDVSVASAALDTIQSLSWPLIVRSAWMAGAFFLFALLGLDLWRLRRIRRNGLPWMEARDFTRSLAMECGVRRPVELLLHEEIAGPLTYGIARPVIVLPSDARDWGEVELRSALVHELEHVRRHDWAVQLAARATSAVYWFHPLVWVAWRRLRLEAERACDDSVVRSVDDTDYAEQLVSLARRMSLSHAQPALGMASRSDLSVRVSAILDATQRRGRASVLASASAMVLASAALFVVAPISAVAQSTERQATAPLADTPAARGDSASLDRVLLGAAGSGDTAAIDRLLEAGANVNAAFPGDGSPLIAAARAGRLAAVRLLLERGADVNMSVEGDGNPLIAAAGEGQVDIATLLLDAGAQIDDLVPDDENPLIAASAQGRLAMARFLVSRGANVNARAWAELDPATQKGEWRTPLIMAQRSGRTAVVEFLKSAGALQ